MFEFIGALFGTIFWLAFTEFIIGTYVEENVRFKGMFWLIAGVLFIWL